MYYKYKVLENKLETESVRVLTLGCNNSVSQPLLHQPGQYAAIVLNDLSRPTPARCFSIISSPSQQQILQFSMRVNGLFTSALQRLQPGDEVLVRGPFGGFVFNENIHKDVVMLAGGIGVAPFMSMVRYASHLGLKNKINLVYSCRTQNDIPFFEELLELEKTNPYLKVNYVISDGPVDRLHGLQVISGRVTSSNMDKLGLTDAKKIYMICGPAMYMRALHSLLLGKGIPKNNILTEAFSQGSRLQTDKLARWPFNAYMVTSISLIISGFFIMASDLYKTLPQLNKSDVATATNTNPNATTGNLIDKINAVGPQVDTNIKQPPVIKYTPTAQPKPSTPKVVTPTPVIVPPPPAPVVVTPAPAPTPTPTVVPKTKPRSRAS